MGFLSETRAWLRRSQGSSHEIVALGLADGREQLVARVTAFWPHVVVDGAGQRLMLVPSDGPVVLYSVDVNSSTTLVAQGRKGPRVQALFLADGHVAVARDSRLTLFTATGDKQREQDFGEPLRLGGEISPGLLSISLERSGEALLVDPATGAIARREAGLRVASGNYQRFGRGGDLFLSPEGHLLRLDPSSGARTVLWAPRG